MGDLYPKKELANVKPVLGFRKIPLQTGIQKLSASTQHVENVHLCEGVSGLDEDDKDSRRRPQLQVYSVTEK